METKANYALIGAFAVAGFLGILLFLMWFAKLQLDRQFAYYDVFFTEVAGLGVSSDVLYAGVKVGSVVQIQLAGEGTAAVRVRIEVTEDTPIRTDSRAFVESQAVTGVANVGITPGDSASALLRDQVPDGDIPVIQSSRSALQTLTSEGPQIIEKLNTVAQQLTEVLGEQNQTRIAAILDNVERSSANLDRAMDDISKATEAIGTAADGIAAFGDKLDTISVSADGALKNFGAAAETADGTLASATLTLDQVRSYIADDLTGLTQRLDQTATTLQTDLSRLALRAEESLGNLDVALASGTGAFDAAQGVFATDLGPIIGDLRVTLGNVNRALDSVSGDLPQITGQLRNAADAAAGAFDSLRSLLDTSRAPVQAFARDALPQFSRLAQDMRGLVGNVDQLVTTLRRNPAQIITGPRTPEFRR